MAGNGTIDIDIEVATPEDIEDLRRLGVTLPTASGTLGDPRSHSDFIDNRLNAVGFGIYIGGYHLYVSGVALPVMLPNALVDLSGRPALAVGQAVYASLEAAQKAVRLAEPRNAFHPVTIKNIVPE